MNNKLDFKFKEAVIKYNALIMLLILFVISSLLSDAFLSTLNIFNLLRQLSPLMIVSIGMLLVILTGGIDLSVGSIACVGGIVIVKLIDIFPDNAFGLLLATIGTIAVGWILGSISGYLVAKVRIAAFVVTLAMMTIARGLAYLITNGQPERLPDTLKNSMAIVDFGSTGIPFLKIPWPVLLVAVAILVFVFMLKYTPYGRLTIATGSNETAVRLAGISVSKYKYLAYAISGALAAGAGIIITSRAAVGTPVSASGLELDAIAACVIGGASLSGGKGTIMNTLIGVLVLGLISNVMNLLSVPPYPQQIIKGCIIIVAVIIQGLSSNKERA